MKLDPFAEAILDSKIAANDGEYVTLSYVGNLLLNMTSGLLPEHLSKDDVELLIEEFGDNWFSELGYSEAEGYKMPTFE